MWTDIREAVLSFFKSRLLIVVVVIFALFAIIVQRLFSLQIVHGDEYVNDFEMKITKERVFSGTRGKIYDRNGKVLAYNELAYSIVIADTGSYRNIAEKNEVLNSQIYKLIKLIEGKGDTLISDFELAANADGTIRFTVENSLLKRFLGDVFGKSSSKLEEKELEATAEEIFDYLCHEDKYDLAKAEYSVEDKLKIIRIRMDMSENNFQKYITTTVAEDVSQETVAIVMENQEELQGVSVEEVTMRRYAESEYFAHIIGYTGKISTEELEELQKEDSSYNSNDVIGKSGIEQYMETRLQGEKGSETLYVNNVGKILDVNRTKEASVGNDVYLTIDMDLQKAVYNLLEQKLAGIVVSKIRNIKSYTPSANSKADDIVIPIDDVYFSLFNNNVIDIQDMNREGASEIERTVYGTYQNKYNSVITRVMEELNSNNPVEFKKLNDEMQTYIDRVSDILSEDEILIAERINKENEVYQNWRSETASLNEYLKEAIAENWIDITKISSEGEYTSSDETYQAVLAYIEEQIREDEQFSKSMFEYMIRDNQINGRQIGLLLYAQGVLAHDEGTIQALSAGRIGAYDFMLSKINSLEITPAQLALDPCSGSCTVTDSNSGEVLAMVTYPGYDNNKLANSVDAEYYADLISDLSKPLYNRATQEKTAPGSTFKMVSSVAGLSEGVISTGTTIADRVTFKEITPSPRCWSSSGHGSINVSQAIEHSCNYFFYQVGYSLSLVNSVYNANAGIEKLTTYATMFGLSEKSGIEITETNPAIADEYPVLAAIGQSNHNFANVQLARYVTAIANSGTVYNLSLLDKVIDKDGKIVEDYTPTVYNQIELSSSIWRAVRKGMELVGKKTDSLKNLGVAVAGKTGTAQENKLRPNHALFVGYAPADKPEIAIAVRIANGYTSANSAEVASEVLSYYFKLDGYEQLISGTASRPDSSTIVD